MLLAQNARNVSLLAIGVGAPLFCGEGCFTALNRPESNYEGTWGWVSHPFARLLWFPRRPPWRALAGVPGRQRDPGAGHGHSAANTRSRAPSAPGSLTAVHPLLDDTGPTAFTWPQTRSSCLARLTAGLLWPFPAVRWVVGRSGEG